MAKEVPISLNTLDKWIIDTAWNKPYWRAVGVKSKRLKSDGCTKALQVFIWICLEHDICYRTHRSPAGFIVSRQTADYIFLKRHWQIRVSWNPLTWIKYPMGGWRWAAVRIGGQGPWDEFNETKLNDRRNTNE